MMRGLADEDGHGFINTGYRVAQFNNLTDAEKINYYYDLENGFADSQQDIFSFALINGGGKFFFKSNGSIVTIPQSKHVISLGNFFGKQGWRLVDTEGTEYYFTEVEETVNVNSSSFVGDNGTSNYQKASWFISKIKASNGMDSIIFHYESRPYSNISIGSVTLKQPLLGSCSVDQIAAATNYGYSSFSGKFLTRIEFSNGSIEFNKASELREDLPNVYRLKSVAVKDDKGIIIKEFILNHSYSSAQTSTYIPPHFEYLKKRLYLDSIQLLASGTVVGSYKFDYYNRDSLPFRASFNQDYWGYYNGSNNRSFFPTIFLPPLYNSNYLGSDNREPSARFAKYGTLSKMVYPTGGYTRFEYELNTVHNFEGVVTAGMDLVGAANMVSLYGDPNGVIKTYSKTFTINGTFAQSGKVVAKVTLGLPNAEIMPPIPPGPNFPNVLLTTPAGSTIQLYHNTELLLTPGVYHLTADFNVNPSSSLISNFYTIIKFDYGVRGNPVALKSVPFGGLRIKRILTNDFNVQRTLEYRYEDSLTGMSYGAATSFPNFASNKATTILHGSCAAHSNCVFHSINSAGNGGLSTTQGSYVGYSKVEELFAENGVLGKTVFSFTNPASIPDISDAASFPYPPETSMDWIRGMKLSEVQYRWMGSNFSKVTEKNSSYDLMSADTFSLSAYGLKVGRHTFDYACLSFLPSHFESVLYEVKTSFPRLTAESVEEFDPVTGNLISQNLMQYSYSANTLLPNEKRTKLSANEWQIEKKLFIGDLTFNNAPIQRIAKGYKALKGKNMISLPAEVATFKQTGNGAPKLIQAVLRQYDEVKLRIDTIKTIPTSTPLSSFSFIQVINDNIYIDSRYRPELIYKSYNIKGLPTEMIDQSGITTSVLYGYKQSLPVVVAKGISYSQLAGLVSEVAIEQTQNDAELRNIINQVYANAGLNSPALYETITHKPLLGVTSKSSTNGRTTYYEYDPFGRLQHVKDHDGNIIKKYCYNYAGQPINCYDVAYTNTQAYSGSFTRNNCGPGFVGSDVIYSVPANSVTSYVSVADANTLAQQKIQQEGQAYANANGSCTPVSSCNVSNCTTNGPQFKCIDGGCYAGYKVYIGPSPFNNNTCMFRYEWWDGSFSEIYYEPSVGGNCYMFE